MGTGDRREGRVGSAGARRPSGGVSRGVNSDPNGLLGRYGDHGDDGQGRSSRGAERPRSATRSRSGDDRYADAYADRRSSSRDAGSRRYDPRDAGDDRYRARERSRAGLRDDDGPALRRGVDRYAANGNGRYGHGSNNARWDRQGRGAQSQRKNSHRTMALVALVLVVVVLPPLLYFGVWPRLHLGGQVNTVFPWAGSTQQTPPIAGNSAFASQQDTVDPAFAAYYSAHAGATTLGTPLTPGFLTRSGIVQFYADGAS